jgi:hypothetical protein
LDALGIDLLQLLDPAQHGAELGGEMGLFLGGQSDTGEARDPSDRGSIE